MHVASVEASLTEPVNGARGTVDRYCMPVLSRPKVLSGHAPPAAAGYNLAL
jgi:hypothetical protein